MIGQIAAMKYLANKKPHQYKLKIDDTGFYLFEKELIISSISNSTREVERLFFCLKMDDI